MLFYPAKTERASFRRLVVAAAVAFCALGPLSVPVSAGIVLSNLSQRPIGGFSNVPYAGEAFVTGPVGGMLDAASVAIDSSYTPVSPVLEIEARNGDGTVGATLDAAFTFSLAGGVLTFTPATSFTLAANTGYFLVLSDLGATANSRWSFTTSQAYTAASGFTIPATNTAFVALADNGASGGNPTYYSLTNGPQLFSLSATVPEPSPVVAVGVLGALLLARQRRWRA